MAFVGYQIVLGTYVAFVREAANLEGALGSTGFSTAG